MTFYLPSPYKLKKAVMLPRKLYMRHKENLDPGFMRSAMELHYYRPAFYKWLRARSEDENLLHEAKLTPESVVLDVGAYTGEWAKEILDLHSPRIIAFEPDPLNFKQLQKKAQTHPQLTAHGFGLGAKTEQVKITLEYLGSSVYGGGNANKDAPVADTQIKDIFETWQSLDLGLVDLMKINIEGAEFPLLERMIETDLLKNVRCYIIQYHEWHPGAYHRRWKIRKAMRKTHRPVWDYHFVWEKWERKD